MSTGVGMVHVYRSVAWFVIFSMLFHSIAEVKLLFAEDEATPISSSNDRKRATRTNTLASENASDNGSVQKKNRAINSNNEQSSDSGGERKYLTSLGDEDILGDEKQRAKSIEVYSELAKQRNLYTESLDVLGPDETSPVLAESVFGVKGKQRVNLIADDIEVKVLMDRLASDFKLNIVSNAVTGKQKMKASLYDLPLETVFQVLMEQANLTYEKRSGIIYLQERGKGQDAFLTERFFKLKEYADFKFAGDLIANIATTKGNKVINNTQDKTIFVSEYQRNLDKIEKVLGELGYLDDLDPDSATFYYHYLSFNYVDDAVVKDIVDKYRSKDGKASYDAKSNRYLVFDSAARFEKMKKALAFVDVPRGQVFIDVIFVDLTENDSKRLGMNTTFDWNPNSPDNADQLVTTLATDVTNFFSYKQPSHITSLRATGIKERSNSNIINNPRLMVLNNEKAVIDVTEKFPYVINENANGVISSKIQNQDIGVKLDVTPRINANREVQLAVKPTITVLKEVKNIVTSVVDTNQANARVTETSSEFPITDERSIDTQVVVPSGRTLVIGGLIKETDRKSADQIPGLGRLPIFGPLFRRKTSGEEKSQLYIFITPTIVRNAPESSAFSANAGDERLAFFPKGKTSSASSDEGRLVLERSETGSKKGKVRQLEIVKNESTSSSMEPVQPNKSDLVATPQESGKVDFSQFIKKIAALKNKERMDKLEVEDQKVEQAKTQKGFDNLIDQLQIDIREEAREYENRIDQKSNKIVDSESTKEASAVIKLEDRKDQLIADKVVGQRASRIAHLLELWEQQPIEGIMTGEDARREQEKQLAERKERERLEALQKELSEAQTKIQNPVDQVVKEAPVAEVVTKDEKAEQAAAEKLPPVQESAITMEKLKQNNVPPKSEKIFEDEKKGEFRIRNSEQKSSEGENLQIDDPNQLPEKTSQSSKTSFLRESYELKVNNLGDSSIKLSDMKSMKGKVVEGSAGMVQLPEYQINTVVSESKNLSENHSKLNQELRPGWEKDFFDKDLAKVVFTDIEDKLELADKELNSNPSDQQRILSEPKITKPVKPDNSSDLDQNLAQIVPVKVQRADRKSRLLKAKISSNDPKTQQIFSNLLMSSQTAASDRSQIVVRSTDSRTQKIFNELFDLPQTKSTRVTNARTAQSNLQSVQNSADADKNTFKRANKQNHSERAFESFLDQMFVPPTNNQNHIQGNKAIDTKTAQIDKPKTSQSKYSKAEEELMNFLDNL